MTMLSVASMTLDHRCQPRATMDPELIQEYADAMTLGVVFPPLMVFRNGSNYWLADGFHRIAAAQQASIPHMNCEVQEGGVRDAILYAVGANAAHGKRRTNLDKRRAVETLLSDQEWSKKSDHEIARICAVSQPFVGSVRKSLITVISEEATDRTFTDRYGNTRMMNTTNIGHRADHGPVEGKDEDEPEEVPFQLVDMRTGEIVPPMSQTHSMSFVPPPVYPTTEQQANQIAADLRARHGAGLAIQVADAIYAQCGKRGAA